MDERARIPVTLPRENPTQSYWQDPPDDIADLRTTEQLPERADVVIIGSGISGAATAWNLLQDGKSSPSIVMLEARQACSGASGRNGKSPFLRPKKDLETDASYRSFLDNAAALGTPAAVKIARLELANINAMHAFAKEHSIPCDSNPCTTVDIIYDEPHWREAHTAVEAMREALGPDDPAAAYSFHDKEEVKTRFYCAGTDPEPVGGVSYAAGSISGYLLGVGVLKLALQKGLNLQTNTPATSLARISNGGDMWEVHTPRGRIVAENVVLATNGYTAHLWKAFQGVIVPLRGQITAHRPGNDMPLEGLPTTYSFIYDNGYEYMIPRRLGAKNAGDIVIGGGLAKAPDEGLHEYGTTDDTAVNDFISSYLYDTTSRYFGENWGRDHPDGRIRKEWTGIMGYTPDGFPLVGEVPGQKGLWASCSFQGHGMVLCWMCARALVQMMRGKDQGLDEWFPEAFIITQERMEQRFQGRLHTSAALENHSTA
ncbi:putative oxidoreductase OrdL [Cytospora mali]|uniref:Oxidoreductase OrdL n=1 Tax=Cytospora mali TaxID=578113 RepID=A0A194W164_CYTMA|nr:putative oxidoreductase OrdL [Valsa mali]